MTDPNDDINDIPKFHYELPETEAIRLLQTDIARLRAKLTLCKEFLRGFVGGRFKANHKRMIGAESILEELDAEPEHE